LFPVVNFLKCVVTEVLFSIDNDKQPPQGHILVTPSLKQKVIKNLFFAISTHGNLTCTISTSTLEYWSQLVLLS